MSQAIAKDTDATTSIWMRLPVTDFENPLPQESECDVCIIGAGISGLTTAYLMLREGLSVIVIDDGPIAGGETGRTTAHLASAQDDRFLTLERNHGEKGSRLAYESHAAAIARIQEIVSEEAIDCDFRRVNGYLFAGPSASPHLLERELEAAHRAGLTGAEIVPCAPITGVDTGRAIRFPDQAQFHPLAYVDGLAKAIARMGGRIHTGVRAERVHDGEPGRVETASGSTIVAKNVVVATNAPITSMVSIPTKQAPYRSYVLSFYIPKGYVPAALYWDTEDPYHYVRITKGDDDSRDVLVVGGEDHKTGQEADPAAHFERLEAWTRQLFPGVLDVCARWSGQVLEPADGVGIIGRSPGAKPNQYVISGDSGQGMTHGTLGAMLITDLVCGRENPWVSLYNPSRTGLSAPSEFVRENANVAFQYLDWLRKGDVETVDQIAKGSGAIVRRGLTKLAVYRDDAGKLHELSAVCPHLGGVVRWNAVEKSWDCPCHGSRFSCEGKVVAGPANSDLLPAK